MSNGDDQKYFIDAHCHLFNVEHVPLRQSIRRITDNLNKKLLKRGIVAAGAALLGPALVLASNSLAKKFYRTFERFIRFFDQPARENIKEIVTSLRKVEEVAQRRVVFTPLVMDFELCEGYKLLSEQASDLCAAIASVKKILENRNALVLPFLGMDLRRFHGDMEVGAREALEGFFGAAGVAFPPAAQRSDPAQLGNGDFIGIKLYPSLGFDMWPDDPALRRRNADLLKAVMQQGLPVTVHCQIDSYECDPGSVDNETLINFAHPHKWWNLLEKYPSLRELRIDFAHFGGEDGVAAALLWDDNIPRADSTLLTPQGLNTNSWTTGIIRLIKRYPNAYADLSAFDFGDQKAVASLAWLLARDGKGVWDAEYGPHRLLDKLIWGSDIPMILSGTESYAKLFQAFYAAIDFAHFDTGPYMTPSPGQGLPSRDELFERLVDINPRRFLFPSV